MLPRPKRLDRASFGKVAAGKRAATRHFSVSILPSVEGRAAVVVSKKVAKRAVDRHLLKRRVLSILASHVVPGRSFVVYARSGSPSLPYTVLTAEITELLTNARKV